MLQPTPISCPSPRVRSPRAWRQAARRAACAALVWLGVTVGAGGASAAAGDFIVTGGYLWHRLPLDDGYGAFLKRRYGVETLDLRGTQLGLGFQRSDTLSFGVELDALSGGFDYKDLNGTSRTVGLELRQTLLVLHSRWSEHVLLGAGLGTNTLTRTLVGYSDDNIVVSNLAANTGSATKSTSGSVVVVDAIYNSGGTTFRWSAGLRYTLSSHTIGITDKRPALDERGAPQASDFVLNGLGYVLALQLLL